jgi:hypothetical protein
LSPFPTDEEHHAELGIKYEYDEIKMKTEEEEHESRR